MPFCAVSIRTTEKQLSSQAAVSFLNIDNFPLKYFYFSLAIFG